MILNIKGALAWALLELAEHVARVAHQLCEEVPDVDGLRADAWDAGRRAGTALHR